MKRHYLIDGYNLMHAIPEIRARMKPDLQTAREGLIIRLSGFAQRKNVGITVVFDGRGRDEHSPARRPKVRVLFSKAPVDADYVIRNLIESSKTGDPLVVVTSDAAIKRAADMHRVESVDSGEFAVQMTRSADEIIEQKYNRSLTKKEVDQWMDLFKKGGKES
ncbi:NYN domain-containing protein [bacterium]|nr:NYN domain-containing protein [bacterium]